MSRQHGLSLIELMVVVVVVGIVALAVTPLTTDWVDEARVSEAKGLLGQAHAEAKAIALRNPQDARGNEVAAGFKLEGGTLLVCRGNPGHAQCAAGGSRVAWQGNWPGGVTTNIATVTLNNRGQVLQNGNPVNQGLAFALSRGGVSDNHVDNRLR